MAGLGSRARSGVGFGAAAVFVGAPTRSTGSRYCPEVDVVVVAYGPHDRLRRCLGSLRAHPTSRPRGVTVVDNSSDPHTKAAVESVLPSATVISSRANLGFTRAVNIGVRRGHSDYVLVLNPDTEVFAGTLDRPATVLDERPEVAVVGTRAALVLDWAVVALPLRSRRVTPDATVSEQPAPLEAQSTTPSEALRG